MPIHDATLKQLRALEATARRGSVTRAADDLYVTPPAVSIQLKELERKVGAPLLERTPEGFELTPVGAEVLQLAESIHALMDRAEVRVGALRSGAAGSVVLGVVSTGKYFAPGIVARFQEENPEIRVTLSIGNRREIFRGIERHEYDLLVMGTPPEHIPMRLDVLGDHPYVMIARPDHPLNGRQGLSPEDLRAETFLTREDGSGSRLLASRFLDHVSDERVLEVVEMGTNETIKQAVLAGLGIALISAHTCHAELSEGRLAALDVQGLPLLREWFLISRADRDLTPAAAIFRDFILENRAGLLPPDLK